VYDRKNMARKPDMRKIQAWIHIKFEIGGVIWFDVMGSSLVFRLANFILHHAMKANNRAPRKAFQATELSIDRFGPFNDIQVINTAMYFTNVFSKIVAIRLHNQK
jgi:hypothetical protein